MDGELHLPQFRQIRAGREIKPKTTAHGRVLIAIHKYVKYSPITLPTELQTSSAVAALIKVHNKTICIARIYNPPDKTTYRLPSKELILFFQVNNNQAADCIMITDDFNMEKTYEVSMTSNDVYEQEMLDEVERLNLTHIFDFFTTQQYTLDFVFVNYPDYVDAVRVLGEIMKSCVESVQFPIIFTV